MMVFLKSLRDSYPEITDEEMQMNCSKKILASYATTTEAMRQLYMTQQAENQQLQEENNKVFSESLRLKDMRLLRL
jgi:hypothetical protein